jgi:hypothetical protein
MTFRHRLTLVLVLAALVIFNLMDRLEPRWVWNGLYWVLLVAAVLTLVRGMRLRRRRPAPTPPRRPNV